LSQHFAAPRFFLSAKKTNEQGLPAGASGAVYRPFVNGTTAVAEALKALSAGTKALGHRTRRLYLTALNKEKKANGVRRR
jgi:hypothetical protein